MRLYAEAKKRKKGLVYTAAVASLMPALTPAQQQAAMARVLAEKLTDLESSPVFESASSLMSRATFYVHPLHAGPRKRGPGKGRTSRRECTAEKIVHCWPTEYAECIYDWMFHPTKGTLTHLLRIKTSEEIVELFLARKRP